MADEENVATAPRPVLSRPLIVRAAIDYVDEEGLTALTMRRLGHSLGVEAMSLYRYVSSREDLLEAMVVELVTAMHLPEDDPVPDENWQAYLVWLANAARDMALAHSQMFPLIATRHPDAPWLCPPLRSLTIVEDFLRVLTRGGGFTGEQAVTAYRAFSSFLLGHLLLEASQHSGQPTLAEAQLDQTPDHHEDLADFPTIRRLAPLLTGDGGRTEFDISLEEIIERLTRYRSGHPE